MITSNLKYMSNNHIYIVISNITQTNKKNDYINKIIQVSIIKSGRPWC